ncbi:hypothetical protein CCACVL1_14578 [Corchorus capsularis]|uniref:Protein kinase domain-containing protein n=1 Tax=Corchorus capsularis TaxID=210143 RepID=A0A1R3I6L4_COCAP|nr:hypothetical protein CCACVL1_14578 [Corchorus capsularis]
MEMGCMWMRRVRLTANSVFLAMASSPATSLSYASRRCYNLFSFPSLKQPHLISLASSSHRRSISISAPSCSSASPQLSLSENDNIPDFGAGESYENLAKGSKTLLKGMNYAELQEWVQSHGFRPGQAMMLWKRLYGDNIWANNLDELEGLNKDFKKMLGEHAEFRALSLKDVLTASDGTRKILFALDDGLVIETVVIPCDRGRTTVCVSSQVGCAMNCQFCYTGRMGLRRHLTTAEIVEQAVSARRLLCSDVGPITNVVFMGMGEPLHNIENVIKAADIMIDEQGLHFSPRKVTISTSGLVPQLKRFLRESKCAIAVSLNATTDEVRNWIMPINRKYKLSLLLETLREELQFRRNYKVLFEYVMLAGINDSIEDAKRLIDLVKGIPCKINLISFNPHSGSQFRPTSDEKMIEFRNILAEAGCVVFMRFSRGDDQMAACGQLGKPGTIQFFLKFLDTEQFQRLRDLKQLGLTHMVYPGAVHSRFEHSLGVYWLASEAVHTLKAHQGSELDIERNDINTVKLAGLLHDVGHGPFSHMFERGFLPRVLQGSTWSHEEMSVKMIDYIVDAHYIDIDPSMLKNAKDMVLASSENASNKSEKKFLYDIVANGRNGIDVDKFDYIVRDSRACGLGCNFQFQRLMETMRVIDDEICYRANDYLTIHKLFASRADMHRTVYTHAKVKAMELMVVDALTLANDELGISASIHEPSEFWKLDDSILKQIETSDKQELEDARDLILRIRRRDLYRYCNEYIVPKDNLKNFKEITSQDIVCSQINDGGPALKEEDVVVNNVKIDLTRGMKNPLESIMVFQDFESEEKFTIKDPGRVSHMLPAFCQDTIVRVYSKKPELVGAVAEAFENFQKKTYGETTQQLKFKKREKLEVISKQEWEINLDGITFKDLIAKDNFDDVYAYRGSYNDQDVTGAKIDEPEFILRAENGEIRLYNMSYIAVEHVCGDPLNYFLSKHSEEKLNFKIVIQLALHLARGLAYLHSKKLIHGNVKTENILIDTNFQLKITDFETSNVEISNQEGQTTCSMAPELMESKLYDKKCDVYSFGICLWEIYCCETPRCSNLTFEELTSPDFVKNWRPEIPEYCPKALANLMQQCWDRDPRKRPEMEQVVLMLEAIDKSKGKKIPQGCFSFHK